MNLIFWLFIIGCELVANIHGQRVAPGVPPQHYQQVPQQQQAYQHPPQQQYQPPPPPQGGHIPVHQQQQQQQPHIPVDHHVPVPQQNIPNQQQHHQQQHQQQQYQNTVVQQQGHNHGHHPQQVLNTANIGQEREHIAEHADIPIDMSKLSEEELQFHYFKMHDADNNNKLDGCELIKSLIHWHEQEKKEGEANKGDGKSFKDEELTNLIDPILNTDDSNVDGFIDYPEFIQAQSKAAGKGN